MKVWIPLKDKWTPHNYNYVGIGEGSHGRPTFQLKRSNSVNPGILSTRILLQLRKCIL